MRLVFEIARLALCAAFVKFVTTADWIAVIWLSVSLLSLSPVIFPLACIVKAGVDNVMLDEAVVDELALLEVPHEEPTGQTFN